MYHSAFATCCASMFTLMKGLPYQTGACSCAATLDISHGKAVCNQCYHTCEMPSHMGGRALLTCLCAPALVCLAALPFALQAQCEEGEQAAGSSQGCQQQR